MADTWLDNKKVGVVLAQWRQQREHDATSFQETATAVADRDRALWAARLAAEQLLSAMLQVWLGLLVVPLFYFYFFLLCLCLLYPRPLSLQHLRLSS